MLLHSQILPNEGILHQFNVVTLLYCHINKQNVILPRLVTPAVTISGTRLLGSTQTDSNLRFNNSSPSLLQNKQSRLCACHKCLRGSKRIVTLIHNLETKWGWVLDSMPLQLYLWRTLRYSFSKSVYGLHSWSGRFGEKLYFLLLRSIEPRIIGRPAQRHYSIQGGSVLHVHATKQCRSFFIKVKCVICR